MPISVSPSLSLEGILCSTSCGAISNVMISPLDGPRIADFPRMMRCRNPIFGANQFQGLREAHYIRLSKIQVAADYSDSVSDSSNYIAKQGYHPLEELKPCKRNRETKLTPSEIAKTTVEANNRGFLVFPGMVHSEPHDHISWDEYEYIIDEYGDIFFDIYDHLDILENRGVSNPVNVFIGMDIPIHEGRREGIEYLYSDIGSADTTAFLEDFGSELVDVSIEWDEADDSNEVHPIYFAKRLTKAITTEYAKQMDHPSNGVSIVGCIKPAFLDQELYMRSSLDDDSYYASGGLIPSSVPGDENIYTKPGMYKLEIMRIELYSLYGIQHVISLQDFQDADPDFLVDSISTILDRYGEKGIRCNVALKALCKKKGLHVEKASLVGVDSLGIDVRVLSGVEVQTHRFPFKSLATSDAAAERQIQQLLYPRSRRKKLRSAGDALLGDSHIF